MTWSPDWIASHSQQRQSSKDEWADRRRLALLEDREDMRAYQAELRPTITESQFLETLWRAQLEKRLGE
jgi:hypothetical protein